MKTLFIEKEVLAILAIILKRTFEAGAEVSRTNTPQWDSLKHVELMFAIEDRFSIQFTEEELVGLDSVSKIVMAIDNRYAS